MAESSKMKEMPVDRLMNEREMCIRDRHRIACGSQTEAAPSDWTFKQGIPEDGREPGERRDSFH